MRITAQTTVIAYYVPSCICPVSQVVG